MAWDGEGVLAGRYRRLERIGQGGMGSVWRAHDIDLDREVAVKELRVPEQVTEEERRVWYARMEREARAAARLRHPGIVTIHDRVVGADGRPWIVMELIKGRSLERLLAERGPLPVRRVAEIGLAMLDALSAANAQGVVHRDVKPANVLLEGDRVVLTDFGIAALEGDATLTRSGTVLGTPAYMSPEQVEGKPLDLASDLWSLGATLYAAVEGHPPFRAPTHGGLFVAIATREPDPPRCGGSLGEAILGLLRKDPTTRLGPDQVRELLCAAATDRPHKASGNGTASTTRVDMPTAPPPHATETTGDRPRDVRAHPIAVRGALVFTAISVVLASFMPWSFSDSWADIGLVILHDSPIPAVASLGLAILFACRLWTRPHRPVLTLATVAFIHVVYGCCVMTEAIDTVYMNDTLTLVSPVGTVALLFACAGVNRSLAARLPSAGSRRAVLTGVVIGEGVVAVTWLTPLFWLFGVDLVWSPYDDDNVKALMGLMVAVWFAFQAVIWSDRLRARIRR